MREALRPRRRDRLARPTAAAPPPTSPSCSTSPGTRRRGSRVVRARARRGAQAPGADELRRLPRRPGGQPAHAARAARRGPRAAARAGAGRGDLLHRRCSGATCARGSRCSPATSTRPREELDEAVPPERIGGRAAVDRAAHARSRSSWRCAGTGSTTRAPSCCAPRRGSRMPTRRRGCCGWPGWRSAWRPRRRAARGRSASPTSRCSTRWPPRCASARRRARGSTRRAPGAGWPRAELARRRTLLGDAPADAGAMGGAWRSRSTRSRCRSAPPTRASAPARRS